MFSGSRAVDDVAATMATCAGIAAVFFGMGLMAFVRAYLIRRCAAQIGNILARTVFVGLVQSHVAYAVHRLWKVLCAWHKIRFVFRFLRLINTYLMIAAKFISCKIKSNIN